jgi:hypothetical protein
MQNPTAGNANVNHGIGSFGLFGFIAFGVGMLALSFLSVEAGALFGSIVGI